MCTILHKATLQCPPHQPLCCHSSVITTIIKATTVNKHRNNVHICKKTIKHNTVHFNRHDAINCTLQTFYICEDVCLVLHSCEGPTTSRLQGKWCVWLCHLKAPEDSTTSVKIATAKCSVLPSWSTHIRTHYTLKKHIQLYQMLLSSLNVWRSKGRVSSENGNEEKSNAQQDLHTNNIKSYTNTSDSYR